MKTHVKIVLLLCSSMVWGCASKSEAPKKSATVLSSPQPVEAQVIGVDALQALLKKADALYQERDYEEAKKLYLQAIESDKKNLRAHYRLGNIAFRSRDWEDAKDRYEMVISLEPRHARAQYNLAMTYLTMAERHLKFYAAHVDGNANLEPVAKLVTALEEISNPRSRSTNQSNSDITPLDKLLDELSKD